MYLLAPPVTTATKIGKSAVVVLSGGQDSTTCLGWACNRFSEIYAITFDYGQRHRIELESARTVAGIAQVKQHKILSISSFAELGGNALTGEEAISNVISNETSLPNTFVPGRNLIFLTFAAAWAYQLKILNVITGVCQTDYSGYPDCRQNTVSAQELAINLGMNAQMRIHTPLMWLTKSESIHLAAAESCLPWLRHSHTCYAGMRPPCGNCPACKLRADGFAEAGIPDPLVSP